MIPRIAEKGRSFKGAMQYYLHDKNADTHERVAFTLVRNLPSDDPDRATAHMIDTAEHAAELKARAGLKAGRKLQYPVYSFSLAWHPSEKPDQVEQVKAALEAIEVLGLSEHQAIIVGHSDTDHPHVHVIANRVHPDTGAALTMSNDQLKLSKWAERYEKERGQVFCEARVQANQDRERGQWVKDNSPTRSQHYEWKKSWNAELWQTYRAERDQARQDRKPAFKTLWDKRQRQIREAKAEIKERFKPQWRDHFKSERHALARFDKGVVDRYRYARRHNWHESSVTSAIKALLHSRSLRRDFLEEQKRNRAPLSDDHMKAIREATRSIDFNYRREREALREKHRAEDRARLSDTKAASDAVWRSDVPSPSNDMRPAAEPNTPPTPAKNPSDAFEERLARIKREREEQRRRDRERGQRR